MSNTRCNLNLLTLKNFTLKLTSYLGEHVCYIFDWCQYCQGKNTRNCTKHDISLQVQPYKLQNGNIFMAYNKHFGAPFAKDSFAMDATVLTKIFSTK